MKSVRLVVRRWVRVLAVLMVAVCLWPSVRQAQPLPPSAAGLSGMDSITAALHAVCTVRGLMWVDDEGRLADGSPNEGSSSTEHCPLCTLGHGAGAPAPELPRLGWTPTQASVMPGVGLPAPRTAAVWLHVPSRAPPGLA